MIWTGELNPCPFCGGEAEAIHEINGMWTVECVKCGALVDGIKAWNTRAPMSYEDLKILLDELGVSERTCKFVSSKGSDYPPVCSACGYELSIYDCAWYEDGTYGYERNYCPNCGAKVVSE